MLKVRQFARPVLPDETERGRNQNRNSARATSMNASIEEVVQRLVRIEQALNDIAQQRTIKEWYSTTEAAGMLGKAEFTVREWCRLGRVHASKRSCGRGVSQEWIIAHEEMQRIRNEGLLPDPARYRHVR